jgi:hypothetical protein
MIIEEFAPETVCIQGKDNIIANYLSYWAKQESKEEELMMITATQSPYGLNIARHKFYELFAAEDAEDYEQDTCPVAYHTIAHH